MNFELDRFTINRIIICIIFTLITSNYLLAEDKFENCDAGVHISLGKINHLSLYSSYCYSKRNYLIDFSVLSGEFGKKKDKDKLYVGASFLVKAPAMIYYLRSHENNSKSENNNIAKILLLSSLIFYGKHHLVILKNKPIPESAYFYKYVSLFIKHSNDFFIFNEDKWINSSIGAGIRFYHSGYFLDIGYDNNFEYDYKNVSRHPFFNVLLGFSFAYAGN